MNVSRVRDVPIASDLPFPALIASSVTFAHLGFGVSCVMAAWDSFSVMPNDLVRWC